jgi:hypothetical protein
MFCTQISIKISNFFVFGNYSEEKMSERSIRQRKFLSDCWNIAAQQVRNMQTIDEEDHTVLLEVAAAKLIVAGWCGSYIPAEKDIETYLKEVSEEKNENSELIEKLREENSDLQRKLEQAQQAGPGRGNRIE